MTTTEGQPTGEPTPIGGTIELGSGSWMQAIGLLVVIGGVIGAVLLANGAFSTTDSFGGSSFNVGAFVGLAVAAVVQASVFFALGWLITHVSKIEAAMIPRQPAQPAPSFDPPAGPPPGS